MEDEIDIRQLIETLFRGKWIVAAITAVALITSGVISFFAIPPTYEATVTLLANQPSVTAPRDRTTAEQVLEAMSSYPPLTVQTHKSQLRNSEVLQRAIAKLGLEEDVHSLRNNVKTDVVKDTSLVTLTVSYRDPETAARIANAIAEEYVAFMNEVYESQVARAREFTAQQIEVESEALKKALDDLKQFLQEPMTSEQLADEVRSKLSLLTEYKTKRMSAQLEATALQAEISRAKEELANTPPVLVTTKSIANDPYLQQLAAELGRTDVLNLSGLKMETEEVNPVAVSLRQKIADNEIQLARLNKMLNEYERAIEALEKDLNQLQAALAEKEVAERQLREQLSILQEAHSALAKQREQTRITEASKVLEKMITIVERAIPPTAPSRPRKLLNMAVAGVLGLMVGVFAVFFMEFWKKSSPGQAAAPS